MSEPAARRCVLISKRTYNRVVRLLRLAPVLPSAPDTWSLRAAHALDVATRARGDSPRHAGPHSRRTSCQRASVDATDPSRASKAATRTVASCLIVFERPPQASAIAVAPLLLHPNFSDYRLPFLRDQLLKKNARPTLQPAAPVCAYHFVCPYHADRRHESRCTHPFAL